LPRLNFRSKTRRFGRLIVFSAIFFVFFPSGAYATTYQVTGAQDFYFLWGEDQVVTVRTYAWQYGIDSMLWVYDSNDNLIIANDDYFGLDSYVSFTATANMVYRVRAGVCCWNPDQWYGQSYELVTNVESVQPPSTTVPDTVPETTTTVPETTTTEQPTTTTESPTTTTVPQTTTTTTEPPTTTTEVVVTTVTPTTLPDVPETVVSTTLPVVDTTTLPEPVTTLPEPTTTSSVTTSSTSTVPRTTTSVAVTTTQPEVVAPTTTTTSEPDRQSNQVDVVNTTPGPILSQVPTENLEQFFESLDMSALSPEEQNRVINELNNASEDVKKKFENTVNIYSGTFDEYVPVGSVITVGERKVLIAATGVLFMAPTISSGATSSSTSSNETRRGRK